MRRSLTALALLLTALACRAAEPSRVILPNHSAPATGPIVKLPFQLVDLTREGQAVREHIVTDPGRQDRALAGPLMRLRSLVTEARPALAESVRQGYYHEGTMTLNDAVCGDAAPKLALILQRLGLPVDVAAGEFHVFDVLEHKEGLLVADPTIRQFFGGRKAPPTVPQIFVGTHAMLERLFDAHAAAKTTKYSVQRIYFTDAVTRNSMVHELERDLTARADLQVLARYLKTKIRD